MVFLAVPFLLIVESLPPSHSCMSERWQGYVFLYVLSEKVSIYISHEKISSMFLRP